MQYFNQCKKDLGPQKKIMVLAYLLFLFSEAEIDRAERINFCFIHYSIEY